MAVGVLITGGAGVLGRHVVRQLRSHSHLVRSTGRRLGRFTDAIWDVEKQDAPSEASGIRAVIHVAARIGSYEQSIQDAIPFFETNVGGTLRVARWCAASRIRKLVFISSAIVYGKWDAKPKTEEDEAMPWAAGAYALSKWQAEHILGLLSGTGCECVILRLSSLYGPGYDRGLIPTMLRQGKGTGTIRLRPPLSDAFDLLHVSDAAATVEQALVTEAPGIWNIGGQLASILEVARICARVTRSDLIIEEGAEARPSRILNWVDDKRARDVLGHQNGLSLEEGIREMADLV